MITIFMRHGDAEMAGYRIPGQDEIRKLTKRGKRETRQVAQALKHLKFRPTMLLSSSLVRAKQTAEIVASEIKRTKHLKELPALAPGHQWKELRLNILKLAKPSADEVILLAGHQPDLGNCFLSALLNASVAPHTEISFPKSGCVALKWEDAKMNGSPSLILALDPKTAKRIRKAK